MATIKGTEGVDTLNGTAGNDELLGLGGDDIIKGSEGSDTINGGAGTDTVDYRGLREGITLTPGGGVTKSGGGKDLIIDMEKIVGNKNQTNTIDASTAPPGAAGLDVDLSKNSLQVTIPSLGVRNFIIENFSDIVGTNGNNRLAGNNRDNRITGGTGDDLIIGSKGNDTLNGGGGKDTLDYSKLDRAVKILPRGEIAKGGLGTDRVSNFETIIGAVDKKNSIDASTADSGASLNLNLAKNSLQVNIPGAQSVQVEIINFVNAIGTKNNDTIVGGDKNSTLIGGGGNDTITGGTKNDRLIGTDSTARGVGEVDTLTGGGGANKFILGDRKGAYYLGNASNDYAQINDFDLSRDAIDIGSLKDYSFAIEANGIIDLFSGKDVNNRDLIAKINLADFKGASMSKNANSSQDRMAMPSMMGGADPTSKINILSGDSSTADAVM